MKAAGGFRIGRRLVVRLDDLRAFENRQSRGPAGSDPDRVPISGAGAEPSGPTPPSLKKGWWKEVER
jgi:hypothetical protein